MTFVVHPAWLDDLDELAFWRSVAATGDRVLVVPDIRKPGIELGSWLERHSAATG